MCALSKEDYKQCSAQARADKAKWESENLEKKPVKINAKARKHKQAMDRFNDLAEARLERDDFDYLNV